MLRTITYPLTLNVEQQKEWKEIQELRQTAKSREKALHGQLLQNPDLKVAAKLAHYSGKPRIKAIVSYNQATVEFAIEEKEPEKPKLFSKPYAPLTPQFQMDPKVLNSLLHGKLLDDDQKRKLLVAAHSQLGEILDPEEPDQ